MNVNVECQNFGPCNSSDDEVGSLLAFSEVQLLRWSPKRDDYCKSCESACVGGKGALATAEQ